METMKRLFKTNIKLDQIDHHVLVLAISIVSEILLFLVLALGSRDLFDGLSNTLSSEPVSLLLVIYIVVSVISLCLSVVNTIKTRSKLKKERARLDTMISYIKVVNSGTSMDKEFLMRKEYETLSRLYDMTNSSGINKYDKHDVESTLDEARDVLIKITDDSQKIS